MRNKLCFHCCLLCIALLFDTSSACISKFDDIYDAERGVTNVKVHRTYIICPNKLYQVGYLDFNNNLRKRQDGGPPLPLRPNMRIQCGNDGKRENLCWIADGHLQVDGTSIRGIRDDRLDNVEIIGFVFIGSIQHSIWITKPGSVTFRDCVWKEHVNSRGPIMLDYHDAYSNDELQVTFEGCRFHDNKYFGYGAQTALVVANSDQNRMVFRRTVFDNNNMEFNNTSPESRTHIIETLGPTKIEDCCFINNQVSSAGVAVYGNQLDSSSIHAANTGGNQCQFASVFRTLQQYKSKNPDCVSGDSSLMTCAHLPTGPLVGDDPAKHFVPFMTNALEYDEALELGSTILEGGCNRVTGLGADGPDAQNTDDPICLVYGKCHISHSAAGEFLVYKFAKDDTYAINGNLRVDISVRVASPRVERQFRLELLYDGQVEHAKTFESPGLGYNQYQTITWSNVPLKAGESIHSLRFWFVNGNINLCAIGVNYSKDVTPVPPPPTPASTPLPTALPTAASITQSPVSPPIASPNPEETDATYVVPPIIWSALDYYGAFEKTPDSSSGGCNWRNDGVDAMPTTDDTCKQRDDAVCTIGWWDAEEYILYRFSIPSNGSGRYDIRVRVASNRAGRNMGLELTVDGTSEQSFETYDVPGIGWQSFDDRFWRGVNMEPGDYILKVVSRSGSINVCSVAVLPSDPNGGDTGGDKDDGSKVVVPGFFGAMYYSEGSNDNTPENIGNCPFRKSSPIDAQIVSDDVCKRATTKFNQHCHIAFTEPNESVVYEIHKKDSSKSTVKVNIRVASYRSQDLKIDLWSADGTTILATKNVATIGRQDWNVYDTLTVWDSVAVGNAGKFQMKITFLKGQVNFCAFGVE